VRAAGVAAAGVAADDAPEVGFAEAADVPRAVPGRFELGVFDVLTVVAGLALVAVAVRALNGALGVRADADVALVEVRAGVALLAEPRCVAGRLTLEDAAAVGRALAGRAAPDDAAVVEAGTREALVAVVGRADVVEAAVLAPAALAADAVLVGAAVGLAPGLVAVARVVVALERTVEGGAVALDDATLVLDAGALGPTAVDRAAPLSASSSSLTLTLSCCC